MVAKNNKKTHEKIWLFGPKFIDVFIFYNNYYTAIDWYQF